MSKKQDGKKLITWKGKTEKKSVAVQFHYAERALT